MCIYTIHLSVGQAHEIVRRRNPMDIVKLLNDIRWKQCSNPHEPSSKGSCKAVTYKDFKIVPDEQPCSGCKGHRDGYHISKSEFSKVVGMNVVGWVKKLIEEMKLRKEAKSQNEQHDSSNASATSSNSSSSKSVSTSLPSSSSSSSPLSQHIQHSPQSGLQYRA